MSQAILSAARELITQKKYDEARAILLTIRDDPTAAKWLVKLDERIGQSSLPVPPPNRNYSIAPVRPREYRAPVEQVESIGMAGAFRILWGLLTLVAAGWLCYGVTTALSVTGNQLGATEAQDSVGYQAGTLIGGGLGLTFFLCTGLPFLLLFGILYWRNGVAIRETKKHNQMVEAMRR